MRRRKAQTVEARREARRTQTEAFGCESMKQCLVQLFQQNHRSRVIAGATTDEEAYLPQPSGVGYRQTQSATRTVRLRRYPILQQRLAQFASGASRSSDPVTQASVGSVECPQLVPWHMETK